MVLIESILLYVTSVLVKSSICPHFCFLISLFEISIYSTVPDKGLRSESLHINLITHCTLPKNFCLTGISITGRVTRTFHLNTHVKVTAT